MPFPTHKNSTKYARKENDSFITHLYYIISKTPPERASGFTSRGSITVEASIVVSIFFFAMVLLASVLEIIYLQTTVKSALCSVGKQMAAEGYYQPFVIANQMESRMVETIGEDVLDNSMIAGGRQGLDCSRSRSYLTTTIMELVVDYKIELPILMFQIPILNQSESIRVKGWNGAETLGIGLGDYELVYVTDYGIVYHSDISCTYLELSIRPVQSTNVPSSYSACEYCGEPSSLQKTVYITEYGNRYHRTLNCQGLKRNIHAVPKKDVYGMGGCSKCVKS